MAIQLHVNMQREQATEKKTPNHRISNLRFYILFSDKLEPIQDLLVFLRLSNTICWHFYVFQMKKESIRRLL